ncbi:MAG: tRNA lysidine(34) synthetase TilS, partial [Mucilaginibacter polytrichastri]|nr:tRNA lysidine(34) synthetase TilS [Mucilaginibacter polytrichastri]
ENNSLLIDKHRFAGLRPKQLLAFELLRPFGFSETVVKEIIGSLGAQAGTHFFSPETRLTIDRRELILSPRSTAGIGPYLFERDQQEISDASFTLKKYAAADFSAEKKQVCIDPDKLIFPLTVRSWQPGDRFFPAGMRGSKKISDLFTDLKFSGVKKASVPLLFNGDGQLIWVCGLRADRRFLAGAGSEKVTIFELCEPL